MEIVIPTLTSLLTQLPVILALLFGFILALIRWQRHPRVSLLTAIATAGFLLTLLIRTFINIWLPMSFYQLGWDAGQLGFFLSISGMLFSVVSAVWWGLLLTAIFGWRNTPKEVSSKVSA